MGCCGCTLHTSAIVAAVFGMIQSVTDLIIAAILMNNFTPEKLIELMKYQYNVYGTTYNYKFDYADAVEGYKNYKALSQAHIAFTVIWMVSSLLLILGISKNHAWLHKQWTIVTTSVIVAGVIMFIIACTQLKNNPYDGGFFSNVYLVLLMALLMRWGIVGLVIDICLSIYVYQRANEIILGPQQPTHVIVIGGQPGAVIHPGMMIPGQTTVYQPAQPMSPYGYAQYGQPANPPYPGDNPPQYQYDKPQQQTGFQQQPGLQQPGGNMEHKG